MHFIQFSASQVQYSQEAVYYFNIIYITLILKILFQVVYGRDFPNIMNLIFLDLILATNIYHIKQKVLTHIIGHII